MIASLRKFDCIVVGSGQAGTPLSGAFAKAGHKTALIESTHIGGCCVNEGCTPTKTMIASGRAAYMAWRGPEYGIYHPGHEAVSVDMKKVRQRKRDIVTSFRGGNESRTQSAGVEVLMGAASFKKANTVQVKLNSGEEIIAEADLIFINTGERPARPSFPGIESVEAKRVLNSTSVQELDEVPNHLVVLGGGYVGLEFAQLFRRLGAEVTVIQRNDQLLPREDKEIADCLMNILKEDGVTVHLQTIAVRVESTSTDPIEVTCQSTAGSKETKVIRGSHLLFAAGRVPNSDMLNLQSTGIKTNSKGYIVVNDKLETGVPGVYALGDVKGPPAFTHISYDDFRIVQNNVLDKKKPQLSITDRIVPYVVYTDPQLGHVGLHEHEARQKFPNKKIMTAQMPMTWVARALETDETRGMMKAVVDADSGQILGFTCLGLEGGEVMSVVQMAMIGGAGYQKLQNAVWAHPSLAESLNNIWSNLK